MKAMIFAAGLGTRLRPLTNDRPKALVEVAGKTLLEHTIDSVVAAGCTTVVVNVHHFADKVIAAIDALRRPGVDILVSDERDLLLETGGGIVAATRMLDGSEPILVHNVDIITRGLDLRAIVDNHLASGAMATLLVKPRDTQRYLLFDDVMKMHGWTNIATGACRPEGLQAGELAAMRRLAFGGIHVLSPGIIEPLQVYARQHGPAFSIMDFYIDKCHDYHFAGYEQAAPYDWLDVGKPETLAKAEALLHL
ncbi:MAG: NTP transferase domain-containing protein [Muribaculaceae bacterium]|nr:NTP transferase domain-containing protein [Muribaculaceae bacterium]